MALISFDFQAGFAGDSVRILVDGAEVYATDGLNTDYSIGLAQRVELDLGDRARSVSIEVPRRGLRAELQLEPGEPGFVSVNLLPDRLECRFSREAPLYF